MWQVPWRNHKKSVSRQKVIGKTNIWSHLALILNLLWRWRRRAWTNRMTANRLSIDLTRWRYSRRSRWTSKNLQKLTIKYFTRYIRDLKKLRWLTTTTKITIRHLDWMRQPTHRSRSLWSSSRRATKSFISRPGRTRSHWLRTASPRSRRSCNKPIHSRNS